MTEPKSYVRTDKYDVLRVGQTRISLDSVVYAYQAGHTAEAIQQQYPALTLEEVYGAIAYYLANREDVLRYLEKQERIWDEQQRLAEQNPSPVIERLRALRAESLQEKR